MPGLNQRRPRTVSCQAHRQRRGNITRSAEPRKPSKSEPVTTIAKTLDLFVDGCERRELASSGGNNGMVENYLKPTRNRG